MLKINNIEVRYGNQLALSIKEPLTFEKGDRVGIRQSKAAIDDNYGINSGFLDDVFR